MVVQKVKRSEHCFPHNIFPVTMRLVRQLLWSDMNKEATQGNGC